MPKKSKAPPGCFWRGEHAPGPDPDQGLALPMVALNTDNPAVAKDRRKAAKDLIIADRLHGDAPRTYEDAFESWGTAEGVDWAENDATVSLLVEADRCLRYRQAVVGDQPSRDRRPSTAARAFHDQDDRGIPQICDGRSGQGGNPYGPAKAQGRRLTLTPTVLPVYGVGRLFGAAFFVKGEPRSL